jgi:hypothetical protein
MQRRPDNGLDSITIRCQQAMPFQEALGKQIVILNPVEDGEAVERAVHSPGTESLEIREANASRTTSQRIPYQVIQGAFDGLQKRVR